MGHLQAWLYNVVQMNLTESEKIERWMGASDHYTSNITVLGQFNWVLKNNELSKESLKKF